MAATVRRFGTFLPSGSCSCAPSVSPPLTGCQLAVDHTKSHSGSCDRKCAVFSCRFYVLFRAVGFVRFMVLFIFHFRLSSLDSCVSVLRQYILVCSYPNSIMSLCMEIFAVGGLSALSAGNRVQRSRRNLQCFMIRSASVSLPPKARL